MTDLIIDKVTSFGDEVLPTMGLELVEVQFRREQHGWVLRVFIDAEGGVNHDHCHMVSRELGDFLDVEDLIDHAYHLEVSSPGLERKLNKIEDFKRFCGRKARLKMIQDVEGQKVLEGHIEQVEDNSILLVLEDGKRLAFSFDKISKARLAI